jgi:hypothetical protein
MDDSKEHGRPSVAPAMAQQKGYVTKKEDHYEMVDGVERVLSPSDDIDKTYMNYDRVDPDIAKYATANGIEVSEEESKRLKRMIDKRVLTIMVFTYFLQALDKGTMSFASIMNIRQDLHLVKQQVRVAQQLPIDHFLIIWSVLMAYDLYLHRRLDCRISNQLPDPTTTRCEIPEHQYHALGRSTRSTRCSPQLYNYRNPSNSLGYL